MASTCVSHDALTGYTPAHDLAFLEGQQRTPAIRGLLYKDRHERPQRDAHVKWDEQCIAEHDKERGTRQKIDEPDTPFVRSPQTSDSEEDAFVPAASSRRTAAGEAGVAGQAGEAEEPVPDEEDDETRIATSPKSMAMLANRLSKWVESGERRESRSSGSEGEMVGKTSESSEASRPETKSVPSKIRLPEEQGHQKASSSEFKARRAKHYNEFAAMKAFRKKKTDSDSSAESDTSDEDAAAAKRERKARKQALATEGGEKGKADGITSRAGMREGDPQESSGVPGEDIEASCSPGRALPNPMEGGRPPVQFGEDAAKAEGSSLPSSEFLAQRRAHYDEGAALRCRTPPSQDGASPGGDLVKSVANFANPMDPTEASGEAAVSFKVDSLAGGHQGGGGNDAWRSKRNAHYRDMAAAFRSKPSVSDASDSEGSS
ncbi:unnamed protein product [Symbiodinium natans]|uniref:Uncharacterized protein n=1 Tax=Symbiodinium natans TaxID=878477 RepID=A0A812Q3X7_9DINO|nr:unnamed protein product [Symbiodinium natans]